MAKVLVLRLAQGSTELEQQLALAYDAVVKLWRALELTLGG